MKRWMVMLMALASTTAGANEADRRLRELSVDEQKSHFTRLLSRNGASCNRVNRVFRQGRARDGNVIWNVACDNGQAYGLLVRPDAEGSSSFITCAALKALKAGECFKAL